MAVVTEGFLEIQFEDGWRFQGQMVPEMGREDNVDGLRPSPLFVSGHKELAAILADSSNPIRSTEPYVPVVPVRGLPDDLSPELGQWLQPIKDDEGFVANWFTAREALEFGWTERTMRRRAMVNPKVAGLFDDCPRGFPLAKWPPDEPVLYAGQCYPGVEVEWVESYAEIVPGFYRDILPRFLNSGAVDRTRLVIAVWF